MEELLGENPDDECMLELPEESRAASSSTPRKRKNNDGKGNKTQTSKRKALNKRQKARVVASIGDVTLDLIVQKLRTSLCEPLQSIFDVLVESQPLLIALIKFHRSKFRSLYRENDKGKEKYMCFQLDWYKHCSILLLPKESSVNIILDPPSDEMKHIHCSCQFSVKSIISVKKVVINL